VLSTENKRYVKDQTLFGLKLGIGAFVVINLLGFAAMSLKDDLIERKRPSPPEWSYLTRSAWRAALTAVDTSRRASRPTEAGRVGDYWLSCLRRLEDPEVDGRDLVKLSSPGGTADQVLRDVQPLALDVRKKSEEWKAGYTEVVLELAKLAEHSQHLVYDRTRRQFFPETTVVGPTNPYPRPSPNGVTPPKEQDCDRAMPDPVVLYNRIIHGIGFSSKQRLDAVYACANWLHFCKSDGEADELYDYATEIAPGSGSTISQALSKTANVIGALKQQASHLARTDRISEALPIYLSCLQAVRDASLRSASEVSAANMLSNPELSGYWTDLSKKVFREDKYPLSRTTGDEPLYTVSRSTLKCVEAELMMYVGEIMYSTSSSRRKDGLAWTREAAEIGSNVLEKVGAVKEATKDAKETARITGMEKDDEARCRECLGASVRNWEAMVAEMVKAAEEDVECSASKAGRWSWSSGIEGKQKRLLEAQEQSTILQGTKTNLVGRGIVEPSAFLAPGL